MERFPDQKPFPSMEDRGAAPTQKPLPSMGDRGAAPTQKPPLDGGSWRGLGPKSPPSMGEGGVGVRSADRGREMRRFDQKKSRSNCGTSIGCPRRGRVG